MSNTTIYPYGQGGSVPSGIVIADDLVTNDSQKALSAKQGKVLNEKIDSLPNIMGRRFVDFGIMPSCVYGEAGCFLGDGINGTFVPSSGAAAIPDTRIKYADVISKYDALVAAYPNYVEKHTFGNDASGTIPMYYYTFTPKYWQQHIYLQAGVHGWEPEPVFALAEIMYLIANAYGSETLSPKVIDNAELMCLRGAVKITVVPCVNPWGFNRRGDCGIDRREIAQNNYNNKQLNAEWNSNQAETTYVRNLLDSISTSLSFAMDMHSTVWPDTRSWYGCFYGSVPTGCKNIRTAFRVWEWLYEFYDVKYPYIVDGDTCPNPMDSTYASVGINSGTGSFRGWFFDRYGKPAINVEFSDHVWTDDEDYYDPTHSLTNVPQSGYTGHTIGDGPADAQGNMVPMHTSAALSVAVNMYLNHIIQQVLDGYNVDGSTTVPAADQYQPKD